MSPAGNLAIAFPYMEMSQKLSCRLYGLGEGILLNVHMEAVKKKLYLGAVQLTGKVRALGGCIEQILLITVHDLQAVIDIIFLCHMGQFPQGVQASLSGLLLIVICDRTARPAGVNDTAQRITAHLADTF